MKRSEINNQIEKFISFCEEVNYRLPIFSYQNPEIINEIKVRQLGFDITDYGSNDFKTVGLTLFTIRNGNPSESKSIPYCEKTMFSLPGQKTPCHYHQKKTEDIFVRVGSDLIIKIWPSGKSKVDGIKMRVLFNGCEYREITSGKVIRISVGETVTLTPKEAHEFYGDPKGDGVLLGEVSTYNDDMGDNYFLDKVARFPKINEDDSISHYLVSDYDNIK